MADVPSGAVTFLFTDIEGSTRLVKQLRDGYPEVLATHQRLLRGAFAAHGGYEVDTQGDSFFVAFASARDALLAAVDGQRAIGAHSWPEGSLVRVRMGLHTGQAISRDGRYTGLAVHRAARIGAAAHGGQILVSQAAQTLLEDEEEDLHVSLRDLGEQRLKDLDRPVRLFQAAAEGLATSFPPVRGDAEPHGPVDAGGTATRRRWAVIGAGLVLVVVAALGFLLLRGEPGGLDGVQPNHVGLIDPETNTIVDEIQVGIRPGPIAADDTSVWVGNFGDRNLTRIDPVTRAVTATIGLNDKSPTGIAVGLGAVWVAHGLLGELSLVDPQFGEPRAIPVAGTAFGSPNGSVALGEGSAWAAFGDSTIVRVSPDGKVLGRTTAGSQPAGVVIAPGSVWVTSSGDATVLRFSPDTFEEGPLRTFSVGTQPSGIAFADDAIWVANSGDDFVTRIDPAGATPQVPVDAGPTAIATGEGSIWVANTVAKTVSRIDPGTNEVVATIEIGNAPAGLAFAGGYVWVSAQEP